MLNLDTTALLVERESSITCDRNYSGCAFFPPQLLVLNLSNNRLQRLESYSQLPSECRNLKGLDLSANEIRSLQELEHVQGMGSVVEVMLKGNPCQEQARDFATYSSSVRKYFPNLERLVRGEGGGASRGTNTMCCFVL